MDAHCRVFRGARSISLFVGSAGPNKNSNIRNLFYASLFLCYRSTPKLGSIENKCRIAIVICDKLYHF